jgi:thiamine biosynthesis protein ThiS
VKITVNGQATEVPQGTSLGDLLRQLQINRQHVAVERNADLVPREHHDACVLSDGDQLEIVTLVGGG